MQRLRKNFQILPIGISENGLWNYAHLFDLVERQFPWLLAAAYHLSKENSREKILTAYFRSNGIGGIPETKKLFRWSMINIKITIETLLEQSIILPVQDSEKTKNAYLIKQLLDENGL